MSWLKKEISRKQLSTVGVVTLLVLSFVWFSLRPEAETRDCFVQAYEAMGYKKGEGPGFTANVDNSIKYQTYFQMCMNNKGLRQ